MGIRVAPKWIDKAKLALKYRYSSQNELAEKLEISRSTITSFLNGKPVRLVNFIEISEALGLDPEEIREVAEYQTKQKETTLDIDALVQVVGKHCHDKIQHQGSTKQLLDISQLANIDNVALETLLPQLLLLLLLREIERLQPLARSHPSDPCRALSEKQC